MSQERGRQQAEQNTLQPPAKASAMFSINPPESFDFAKPQDWEKWIRRFERFRAASSLDKSSDANQVNTLIYCMGDEADDVLRGLTLTPEQKLIYSHVRDGFTNFFVPKKKVIYQRAKFNQRAQGPSESADSFITALYALAEDCDYGALRDELLRDRIVVGIRDTGLSQKMQMESRLDLAKAINMVRQAEDVKRQQMDLRGDTTNAMKMTVDTVHTKKVKQPAWHTRKLPVKQHKDKQSGAEHKSCFKCGKSHAKFQCPAKNADCHNCGKRGHYSNVCRSTKSVSAVTEDDDVFLGTVDTGEQAWTVDLQVRQAKVRFKIDTGADVSVIPERVYRQICKGTAYNLTQSNKTLFGPGRVPLSVVGVAREVLKCGDKHTTEDIYVVKHLNSALLSRTASVSLRLVARVESIDLESVKQQYPKLCGGLGLVQHQYTIKLRADAKPVSLKVPRRVPLPLMGKVKQELQRMEQLGVISRIEQPTEWCSGMVVAPKKCKDEIRICVDLSPLNEAVCREKFILPSVDQTLGMLSGAKFFTKLDANMGFWQIPLSKDCAHYTTFITPFGRYFFNRLPFGIASAPEHFQNRMVTEVTEGLEGVVCHMDDVLIWGSTQAEHDTRVHAVLQKAQAAGITLNTAKCEFSKTKVKFLGVIISPDGISPDPEKTRAVREMDPPHNISELRSFLAMVNQLGKFVPNLAEKDKALRDLLSKKKQWYWGPEQQRAFTSLKNELASTPVLQLYDPNKELKISADASSYGLGSVLLQKSHETWAPVAYASRALTSTEQRYAQVEKEALALTWACERFSDFITGLHFEMETDHKPLVSLLGGQALDSLPPRIQRFRMRLMRYRYTIRHVPGKSLTTADTLSRAPLKSGESDSDNLMEETNIYVDTVLANLPASETYLSELRKQLSADSVCAVVMKYCTEGWPDRSRLDAMVRPYWTERGVLSTHNGLLLRGTRLVIPAVMRNGVLEKIHEGHQGIVKCRERAKQSVWWPGLSSQIGELVLKCTACVKERANVTEPLMPSKLPDRPWQKLGADLFTLKNKEYLLVVDYFSRYVEVALLCSTRSVDAIKHLKSIFARHGIPETLVTDNGPQFTGAHMTAFATEYEFEHVTSSPKYPQSNGEAERAVQTIKTLLKKATDPYRALLAYRNTPLSNGFSPAQLLMGRRLRTTVPVLPAVLEPAIPDLQSLQCKEREKRWMDSRNYDRRHRVRNLSDMSPGDQVWITDTRSTGTVTSAHESPRSYLVSGPQGTVRRNRRHLVPMSENSSSESHEQAAGGNLQDTSTDTGQMSPERPQNSPRTGRTRSGRSIKKPDRLDL